MDRDNGKELLSVSKIKMYLRCPLQYYYRYCEGIKIPPDAGLTLGKAVHSGIEQNFRQKITSFSDLPLNDVLDIYSTAFESYLQEEFNFGEDKPGDVKDLGVGLVKVYHAELSPKIQPVSVEEHFILEFEAPVEYGFQGYMDVIDAESNIRDSKTAKRSYAQNAAENDLQLTAYNLAYKFLKGKEPKALIFDVMVKNKTPKVQTISSPPRGEAQLNRLLKLIGFVSKSIKTGVFYPCENGQVCSWCGYRKDHCSSW
ncbi:MAG: hypothetical protein A2252_09125 [Elusimicrobia bacterium RIFOXYA2_FULL_39_19]|nr:MAG: hypothetical protein A2252_09125 [Elusimicrobia bacterium RIFOXYA2_FULL_39_19]